MSLGAQLPIVVLLGVALLQGVSLSALLLFQRKNLIHAKAGIARTVGAQYQSGNAHRLFFPFASSYVVSEFAAYLNYRGTPVEGATIAPDGLNPVVMVGGAVAKDGPCVSSRRLICHAGSRPDPGDLVIVLPDDNASLAEVIPYREPEELLFSYEPYPLIPQWLRPFVKRLHVASPLFFPFGHSVQATWPHTMLSDRWLDASVTVWK